MFSFESCNNELKTIQAFFEKYPSKYVVMKVQDSVDIIMYGAVLLFALINTVKFLIL